MVAAELLAFAAAAAAAAAFMRSSAVCGPSAETAEFAWLLDEVCSVVFSMTGSDLDLDLERSSLSGNSLDFLIRTG